METYKAKMSRSHISTSNISNTYLNPWFVLGGGYITFIGLIF